MYERVSERAQPEDGLFRFPDLHRQSPCLVRWVSTFEYAEQIRTLDVRGLQSLGADSPDRFARVKDVDMNQFL